MAETRIVVVGAGVSGLTTALLLSKHPRYKITVVAKHMPGDYSIDYASPWAGANYEPVSKADSPDAQRERATWPELARLASECPEAGVHFQEARNFRNSSDSGPIASQWSEPLKADAWFREVVPEFRSLERSELRSHESGTAFTSVCINTALYLHWLVSQCLAAGVVFKRASLTHISEAASLFVANPAYCSGASDGTATAFATSGGGLDRQASLAKVDVVVNATGLGSFKLGGVEDGSMYPARGQTVLVGNEAPFMGCTSGTSDGDEERCYAMTRAAGGGTILGGTFQPHNWSPDPDPALADRIIKRCVALVPELVGAQSSSVASEPDISKLDIIRHGVGLRPCRNAGVRLERERIGGEDGVWVVHNYGHGGYGYQSSYGCAMEAVKLVGECVEVQKRAVAA